MLNRDVRARRQAPPQAKLRHSLTAPVGGRICRRRKRETERRRAGKIRIALTLNEKIVSEIRTASARSILFSRRGRKRTCWKGLATRARAKERPDWSRVMRRPWQQDGTRRPTTSAHTPLREQQPSVFCCFTRQ